MPWIRLLGWQLARKNGTDVLDHLRRVPYSSTIRYCTFTLNDFVTQFLLKMLKTFNDTDVKIGDRLVVGVSSPKVREILINMGKDLTLEKSIRITQRCKYVQE